MAKGRTGPADVSYREADDPKAPRRGLSRASEALRVLAGVGEIERGAVGAHKARAARGRAWALRARHGLRNGVIGRPERFGAEPGACLMK